MMKRFLVLTASLALLGSTYALRTLADGNPPVIHVPGGGPSHGGSSGGSGSSNPPVIHVPGGGPSGPPVIHVPGGGPSGPGPYDGGYYNPGYDDDGYYHHNDNDDDDVYVSQPVYVSCAPQAVDSNVQVADRTLANLGANELSTAETFKRKVAEIAAMPSGKAKTDAYFRLVGLQDAANPSEVLNFIYARQVDAKYVKAVADNLQLTSDQAALLINRLTAALKPRQ